MRQGLPSTRCAAPLHGTVALKIEFWFLLWWHVTARIDCLYDRASRLLLQKTECSGASLCEVHCRQSKFILDECMCLRQGMRH